MMSVTATPQSSWCGSGLLPVVPAVLLLLAWLVFLGS
jgi:hypothetical protein